jgi:hypothetical protein
VRLVRAEGLEPPCLAAFGPKPSASTSSATPAHGALPEADNPPEGRPYIKCFGG